MRPLLSDSNVAIRSEHSVTAQASQVPLGTPIVRLGAVTSTMDVARRLERFGAPEGVTVVASSQSQGRGRAGRAWQSPPDSGLYCSILLRPEIDAARLAPLALAMGLAVCEALDPAATAGIQVKWPNDLLVGNRKLGGMLVTTSIQGGVVCSAIVGIGVNLTPDRARPLDAISLTEIPDICPGPAPDILPVMLASMTRRYRALCEGAPGEAMQGWQTRLAFLGQRVTVREGDAEHTGRLSGINESGGLVLETGTGPNVIYVGDVTRGPVPLP